MAVDKGDVLRFASSQGLGSALSGGLASGLYEMAQQVRSFASAKAAEIEALTRDSQANSGELAGIYRVCWEGTAAQNFRLKLGIEEERQRDIAADLSISAIQTRYAGESLASHLEGLAASLASAGSAVDTLLGAAADASEMIDDILTDSALMAAQAQLESLANNPLISSLQAQLYAVGR